MPLAPVRFSTRTGWWMRAESSLAEHAGEHVGVTTGGVGHDDLDRLVRPARLGARGARKRCGEGGCAEREQVAAGGVGRVHGGSFHSPRLPSDLPPSTKRVWPVMKVVWGEARKAMACAICAGSAGAPPMPEPPPVTKAMGLRHRAGPRCCKGFRRFMGGVLRVGEKSSIRQGQAGSSAISSCVM